MSFVDIMLGAVIFLLMMVALVYLALYYREKPMADCYGKVIRKFFALGAQLDPLCKASQDKIDDFTQCIYNKMGDDNITFCDCLDDFTSVSKTSDKCTKLSGKLNQYAKDCKGKLGCSNTAVQNIKFL